MGRSFAAVVGGIGGGVIILLIVILVWWFFRFRLGEFSNGDSETSDLPAADTKRSGATSSYSVPPHEVRQFIMEELEQATRQFDENNLIGYGTFGLVYKGFLSDGTIVAIKRRNGHPQQEFSQEAIRLSTIQHRNVVKLLGYCQEGGCQMLIFEYLPNGSICNHLYGSAKDSITKLEFKQRLNVAIGAAKGLSHLHDLQPPVVHSDFKTANVLVDENFFAKVADAGIRKLVEKIEDAGSSSSASNTFRDPELRLHDVYSEMNDVYSFGIFLLELISGKEATNNEAFQSNDTILQWVQEGLCVDDLVDHRLVGSFTAEGMKDVIKLMLKCMSFPGGERPRMEDVSIELEQILEREMTRTSVMGEGTATVIPGSELFTN